VWGNDFTDNVRILWDSTLVDCAVVIRRWRALLAPATFGAVKQSISLLIRGAERPRRTVDRWPGPESKQKLIDRPRGMSYMW
jgi:hypothetical protein